MTGYPEHTTHRPTADGGLVHDGIVYATVRGFRPLLLDLHVPAGPGPFPVVVWIHGGGFAFGDRRFLPDTVERDAVFTALAAAGIATATIDYRLSGEAHFPAQLDDVTAALAHLRANAEALGLDAERIGIWGESAGGTFGALAALGDGRIAAAVCWYPLTDLAARWPQRSDSNEGLLLGGSPAELPELAALGSPVAQVGPGAPPFLLLHGTADRQVPSSHSEQLHERLLKAGGRSTYLPVPGADHCFEGYGDVPELIRVSVEFLARELGTRNS
ncbi:acetyl esterase/lipase [Kitasatospora sp. MAA4]|uniref:alpha/beta hydrolase n=1 Tax=Kitasatospora sp. MAA4 TaxID=3035093 RepID=UPI002475F30D|nr:alpha/beta hydrolase [Kitasatospora sp. MAA4]MDH6130847.1 acetyl esterase/lipase [Kitasatospora sp. MAA4]